jgi:hypothetical protein
MKDDHHYESEILDEEIGEKGSTKKSITPFLSTNRVRT